MRTTILSLLLLSSLHAYPQFLVSKTATISFFSSTPVEDIAAVSKTGSSAINPKTGDILFKVNNTSFRFEKKMMQEHFNENYMESDRYPTSEFRGKITDPVDYSKAGTYQVTVKGTLNVHGVTKSYQVPATLTVNGTQISAACTFNVSVADHKIKIPSLVIKNIAEVMQVKVSATYQKN
ncbi:YceI family protein [Pedobacter yulinensis]|uniref:YceI family protein n=1 Tax=Pedobacter yulinensis TaxID=2126353 RepID=A0A2T3HQ27_9SPHI|nr:YceI family protein [Pedobacter yulinensis]PST84564.1 YceI family protein [Pedobacter yulinensis]